MKIKYVPILCYMVLVQISQNMSARLNEEHRLKAFLQNNLNPNVRPVLNKNHSVKVYLDLRLKAVLSLDERNQRLSLLLWFRLFWTDETLVWNPSEFGDIDSIYFGHEEIWKPDVALLQSIDHMGLLFETLTTEINVHSDGTTRWVCPQRITTTCNVDIKNYPFDVQECPLTVGPFSYHINQTDLFFKYSPKVDTSILIPNNEWKVESMAGTRAVTPYQDASNYVEITYILKIRRRTVYHLYNVVLPGVIIAVLVGVTFTLPPACGERIAFCVTNVLSMMIFALTVSNQIPRSDTMPVLLEFLTALFILAVFALIVTCFVIKASYSTQYQNNFVRWLVCVFTNKYLATILCLKSIKSKSKDIDSIVNNYNSIVVPENKNDQLKTDHEMKWIDANLAEKEGEHVSNRNASVATATTLTNDTTKTTYIDECTRAARVWDRLSLLVHFMAIIGVFIHVYLEIPYFIVK